MDLIINVMIMLAFYLSGAEGVEGVDVRKNDQEDKTDIAHYLVEWIQKFMYEDQMSHMFNFWSVASSQEYESSDTEAQPRRLEGNATTIDAEKCQSSYYWSQEDIPFIDDFMQ